MSTLTTVPVRTGGERLFHASLFEVLAIGLSAPLAAWLTGRGVGEMGMLTAEVALMALIWNIIYNWVFDRCQARLDFARTMWLRALHAFLFELGLLMMAVPFIAWSMGVSLWQAVQVDIGLVLFYLPYTFFYNLAYDAVRARVTARPHGQF